MRRPRKKKRVTTKAVMKVLGMAFLTLLLIAAVVARVWHFVHHHSN